MNKLRLLFYFIIPAFLFSSEGIVYRIPIQDVIDLGLPPYIERSIEAAEEEGASVIIFDIDTFGGRVDAATQIKDAIMASKIPTVAFINRRAISAGALISLSCEKIYMTPGSTIGAATAVDLSGKKGTEKTISYMREEMASTAEARGRSKTIAKGMVDEELSFEYIVLQGDTVDISELEGRKEGKLITLTADLALKLGIADGMAETLDDLLMELGFSGEPIREQRENWSENFVRFLTNPVVSSLLMTFGFLGVLFELKSPGWGIPGTVGAICLSLSLGASYIAELATVSDLLIILAGVLLLILEMAVIPGFGLAGISGIVLVVYGLYALLLPDVPVGPEIHDQALFGLSIGILGGLLGLVLLFQLMIRTKFWKKLTSPGMEKNEDGYAISLGLEEKVGARGTAVTDLRPSGWITLENDRVFVVTEGNFVTNGETVEVIKVDGNRVVVRSIQQISEEK